MVVLEGPLMTSPSGHQYLQPDYLSPLPTTLDAKKSPLALLAQTCSQIGADSPAKAIPPPQEKQKKERNSPREATKSVALAFKPYETNVVSKRREERRKSASPKGRATPARSSGSGSPAPDGGASPIIRSGMEVLKGCTSGLEVLKGCNPSAELLKSCPSGIELLKSCAPGLEGNPAFRPPYALYPSWLYRKDLCKDPYCSGCSLPVHPAPCACAHCEHKYMSLYLRPYVCSWISSDKYCGQRFASSDELLAHLRSHTAPSEPPPLHPLPRLPLHPRYHPYSKPLPLPLPLPPYYPYLYPQRLPVHP